MIENINYVKCKVKTLNSTGSFLIVLKRSQILNAPLNDFYEYFEKLNQNIEVDSNTTDTLDELDFADNENVLNAKLRKRK